MQQAVEWNAGHFLVWLELGRCQQALGLAGPATISFNRARELNPRSDEVRAALVAVSKTGLWLRWRGLWRQLFNR
jgi:cytochrome c-type biogenesis protein CcmH/NrfG